MQNSKFSPSIIPQFKLLGEEMRYLVRAVGGIDEQFPQNIFEIFDILEFNMNYGITDMMGKITFMRLSLIAFSAKIIIHD